MRPLVISSVVVVIVAVLTVFSSVGATVEFSRGMLWTFFGLLLLALITAPFGFVGLLKRNIPRRRKVIGCVVHGVAFLIAVIGLIGAGYLIAGGWSVA